MFKSIKTFDGSDLTGNLIQRSAEPIAGGEGLASPAQNPTSPALRLSVYEFRHFGLRN